MNYQRQQSGGTVIESIDGEHYINGVHVKTGKLKTYYYIVSLFVAILSFFAGYLFHAST